MKQSAPQVKPLKLTQHSVLGSDQQSASTKAPSATSSAAVKVKDETKKQPKSGALKKSKPHPLSEPTEALQDKILVSPPKEHKLTPVSISSSE